MILSKDYFIEGFLVAKGSRLTEELSLEQMRQKYFYTGGGNDHLKRFYKDRVGKLGQPNTQIKLIETKFDYSDNGSMNYFFLTESTPYDDPEHEYKELKDAPSSPSPDGKLINDPSKTYTEALKITDFYDLLEELNMVGQEEFTKENLKAILELSQDVKISCSCPSHWWQSGAYYLTQDNAALIPCTIAPKRWNLIRPNVAVCKHLQSLLTPQSLTFLLPQMAMASKTVLIKEGFIQAVPHSAEKNPGRKHK